MGKAKILIIEDDHDIVEMIEYNLKSAGFDVINSSDGHGGLKLVKRDRPDLIILDIMLPGLDGFDICRILRSDGSTSQIPIIILSAKSQETDKVVGLELGADDYMTKPFSPRELIARVKAILRRSERGISDGLIEKGKLVLDKARRKVTVSGEEVILTATEFNLLEYLARRSGVVLSRGAILDGVYGDDAAVFDRTIDAHIKSLRSKLGDARDYIETIRGVGYRFREE